MELEAKKSKGGALNFLLSVLFIGICLYRFDYFVQLSLPQSTDLCWLLRTGDWIIAHRQLPLLDPFCWWHPERSVVSYQWLFDIFVSGVHRFFGLWGLGWLSSCVAAFFLFWLLPRRWFRFGISTATIFAFLALIFSPYWQYPRPQLFVWIYFQILFSLLEQYIESGWHKRLYFLPLLILLWANTHPTVTLGLLTIIAFFARGLFSKHLDRGKLILIVLLSASSIFITPTGSQFFLHGLSFVNGGQYLKIHEVLPSYLLPDMYPFLIYTGLALTLILTNIKKLRIEQSLLSICFIVLGLCVNRFEPLSVIASWTCVGQALSMRLQAQARPKLPHSKAVLAMSILIATLAWSWRIPNQAAAQQALLNYTSPNLLVLPKLENKVRLFNDPLTGNCLIYLGQLKPFISNQFDNYSKEEIKEVADCLNGDNLWASFLEKERIDSILLQRNIPLNERLKSSGQWKCTAYDGSACFWTRSQRSP